jgi:tetratricopeptide (TPR) repeat protein
MREAIGYHRKVLAAAPELDEPELLGIPSFAIGNVLLFQGHMGKARKLLGEGMIALAKTENWFFWTRAVAMRSLAMTMMGDCRAAQAEGEQARDRGREINASLLIVSSNLMLSAAYLYENPAGDGLKRTLEASREGLETAEKSGDRVLLYLSYGVQAWNLAMGGRFEEASAVMEKCLFLAKQSGGQLIMLDQFTARQADITLGLGRVEETLNLAEQAIGIARQMGGIWAEGHARRTLGRALAALTSPRWDEAEAQMAQSVQLMESGQNLMGVAHTEIAWGEVCRDRCNLDDARDHWGKAAAFFESKGLAKRLEQVRALMSS